MDIKPVVSVGEDSYFEAMRNGFREAQSPDVAEAGCKGWGRQDPGGTEAPTQPQPSETAHPEASRRDWITTW